MCDRCNQFINNQTELFAFVEKKPREQEIKLTNLKFIKKTLEWYFNYLSQMLSTISFSQIKSTENLEKIELKLRILLQNKKQYTDSVIDECAARIWHEIEKEAAERVTQVSVTDQIISEISRAYSDGPNFLAEFNANPIKTLRKITAVSTTISKKRKNF